jgi:hypothetical protein
MPPLWESGGISSSTGTNPEEVAILRRLLITFLIVALFAIMVVGAGDFEKRSEVKYTDHEDSVITQVFSVVTGTKLPQNTVDVVVDGSTIATIPEDSKFAKITNVHEDCLKFQYGTDLWFSCEEAS